MPTKKELEEAETAVEIRDAFKREYPGYHLRRLQNFDNFDAGFRAALSTLNEIKVERAAVPNQKTADGQRLSAFTIDAERAKTFHEESGFVTHTIHKVYYRKPK